MPNKKTIVLVPLNTRQDIMFEGVRGGSKLQLTVLENPSPAQLKEDPATEPEVLQQLTLTHQARSEIVQALRMFD